MLYFLQKGIHVMLWVNILMPSWISDIDYQFYHTILSAFFYISFMVQHFAKDCWFNMHFICFFITGELQEWWNPQFTEVCPSRRWFRTKIPAASEGGCKWNRCPPLVCVFERKAPIPLWWSHCSHVWPKVYHVESRKEKRCLLEFWEVPGWSWRWALQTL